MTESGLIPKRFRGKIMDSGNRCRKNKNPPPPGVDSLYVKLLKESFSVPITAENRK